MVQYCCPDLYLQSILELDLEGFREKGYNALLFDLDNTLLGWRDKKVSEQVREWLIKASDLGFKMCIVSNSLVRRVTRFSNELGIPAIPKAVKPRKKVFLKALSLLNATPSRTLVIGDQIFTDVLGGKRLGLYTILVVPVDRREFFTTVMVRIPELVVLFFLRRMGILRGRDS